MKYMETFQLFSCWDLCQISKSYQIHQNLWRINMNHKTTIYSILFPCFYYHIEALTNSWNICKFHNI